MIRSRGSAGTVAIVAAALAWSAGPTRAQDFGERSLRPSFPVESRPKVDEKAYKAALEKIPVPNQKYDPWGTARPAEASKSARKPN
jgi:hypothetical protein